MQHTYVHTKIDKDVYKQVAVTAAERGVDKCEVFNTALREGLLMAKKTTKKVKPKKKGC